VCADSIGKESEPNLLAIGQHQSRKYGRVVPPLHQRMKHEFDRILRFPDWVKPVWLILCLLGMFIGIPNSAYAEEVAILKSAEIGAYSEAIDAFKSALPSSFQVRLEYDLQGDMAKGRNLARRIRASDASVVLAVGLKAALAAKLEILDIPVIMCLVLDPEKYGLPTSNMVGLSLNIPFEKHLKPLQTLAPLTSRIGVLFDPQKTKGLHDQLQQDAKAQGITIVSKEVHGEQEVSKAFKELKSTIDALWLLPDSTVLTENTLDFLISATLEANIPLVAFSAGLVQSGAVVGVYMNYADIGRQAAGLPTRLLSETPPAILGTIVPPDHLQQAINRKSGTYLGFQLTSTVLRQFNEQY
jgi:putative ABC transport system substrate-binding protein